MNIGIDISMLVYRGSGVATYTFNLVKYLLEIDKKNTYHLFYSSLRRPANFTYLDDLKAKGGNVHDLPFPPRVLKFCWNTTQIMPVEWFTGKVDIFHSSDFLRPPLLKGTKGVTTIHDLTWKKHPEFHTQDIIDAHERKLKRTIAQGDVIIVDSQKTKEDLYYYYPHAKNPVFNVPLGVDQEFFKPPEKERITRVIERYKLKVPYILYVGAIEPRKNIPTLVTAFNEVLKTHPEMQLVLAGRAGWKNEEVFALVDKYGLKEKVRFTGYIEESDLPALYQGAILFVYPSLYEGFGLPPLEALASKTPTIAYNSPSLDQEFVDYIDPMNLAKEIVWKIKSPEIPPVKILTWKDVAQKTLEVYEKMNNT
ncbi:glycosyltransferase family 1 protein [soil metagenome]